MYKNIDVEYGFQVVLSTIPNQEDINFEDDIEKHFFESYKNKIGSKDDYLYSPLKFYMLGSYDVCYISLIDNFKFAHRLFEPKREEYEDDFVYNDHAFQSYSGFALNDKSHLEQMFTNKPDKYFTGIINLKLNNGLLIGNGLVYIEAITDLLKKIINIPFLIFQTFSWFEISLVLFVDYPEDLSKVISDLRSAEFKDLDTDKFDLSKSLYKDIFPNESNDKIGRTSVFSDTHTYFGLNEKLIKSDEKDKYFQDFKKLTQTGEITLKTEVEWHVKPGHVHGLENTLSSNNELKDLIGDTKKQFVLGKSDYLLKEKETNILSNIYLIRHIIKSEKYCDLFNDVRKIKSYVYLDSCFEQCDIEPKESKPLFWFDKLNKLCVTSAEFLEYDKYLKSLKISRQVRNKVLKIFSNYNNGIQNPILFPYFLDFTVFVENLKKLIKYEFDRSKKVFIEVRTLEKKLNENIKVFQEGYNVRFLNGYHFENISDFDLDFNNSIQQLLSSYGTFVYEYGKSFYKPDKSKNEVEYSPIIQLNDIDTISNDLSINYSVHHLTSPEFVFATILKELLNHLELYNEDLNKQVLNQYNNNLEKIKDKINESYLDDMFDSNLIEVNYFIIDSIRFGLTFNYDFDLFSHWFWSYNFQNSALFNTSGMINEYRLRMELFRIMLIKNYFGIKKKMKCPSPEIYSYWKMHYKKIDKISKAFLKNIDKDNGFLGFINGTFSKYFDNYTTNEIISNSKELGEAIAELEKIENRVSNLYKFDASKIGKFIFNQLKNKEFSNNLYFLDDLMWKLLNSHYESNDKSITTMKRDWCKGEVLPQYKKAQEDVLYSIDPTGGVYFSDTIKTKKYFKDNAECLLKIIDFSLKQKKQFISERVC
ncbi:hypothetical protein DFQ09_10316 [Winogradskyella pacifica]|uniref:Uncharacterized protein n=1 Tax=Winogradskyella pacifica TaxID=664642 RepID=A0A3D9N1I3_9FLAO|nr:hypothetical protein [Winogradskyella pacifica]REE24712.1 hypothetical protein DFQ09_10316 [Winogradskyella pacifica]